MLNGQDSYGCAETLGYPMEPKWESGCIFGRKEEGEEVGMLFVVPLA